MTKVPTLVKIDEFKGRQRGGDLDIVDQWMHYEEELQEEIEKEKKDFFTLGGDYWFIKDILINNLDNLY